MAKWEYTETELWRHGEAGISLFHVFGLIAVDNTVLTFAEAREGDAGDADSCHSIYMRRSADGGRSFEENRCLIDSEGAHCWTNAVPVYDRDKKRLFLFYSDNQTNCYTKNFLMYSDDLGVTWSKAKEITELLNAGKNEVPFHLAGPGHGIQIQRGAYAGRLLMPFWHRKYGVEKPSEERGYCISFLYSDDHGDSWKQTDYVGRQQQSNETRVVETQKDLLWVIRPGIPNPGRYICRSKNGGITWSQVEALEIEPARNCDAGAIGVCGKEGYENMVLISRVSRVDKRNDMEILISLDGGRTFANRMSMPAGDAMPGYSDLCVIEGEEPVVGLLHCRCNHVLFSRISLQTLTGGKYEDTKREVWL